MHRYIEAVSREIEKRASYLLLLLLSMIAVLNFMSILTVPAPWCDEPFLSSISINFFRSGRFGVSGLDSIAGLEDTNAGAPRLYHLGQGLLLTVLGNTLWVTRFYSVIAWALALVLIYVIGRELYDRQTGLFAAVILASSLNTFMASHLGRQEMWTVTGVLATVMYYLISRKQASLTRFLFLGFLMGITLGLHTNAIWFQAALAAWIVWHHWAKSERNYILATGIGGLVGAVAMVLLQILPDPQLAVQQYTGILNDLNGLWSSSLITHIQTEIAFVIHTYFTGISYGVLPFTLVMLLSTPLLVLRRNPSDRFLLWLWWGSHLLFAIGMAHKNPRYAPLWDSFAALGVGTAIVASGQWLVNRLGGLHAKTAAILLIIPLVAFNASAQAWFAYKYRMRDLQAYEQAILSIVPPATRVLGDYSLLYTFDRRNEFISDVYLAYYTLANDSSYVELREDDLAAILDSLNIDYVIYRGTLVCNSTSDQVTRDYYHLLDSSCSKVGQVHDSWNGTDAPLGSAEPTIIFHCSAH